MKKILFCLFIFAFVGISRAAYPDYGGYAGAFHGTSADAWVLESGGTLTIKSGGSLIANTGAIVSISSSVTSNNLSLTYGISAATGTFSGAVSAGTLSATTITASSFIQHASLSAAIIKALTPVAVGQIYYCSDCSTVPLCVSTGTAVGAFSLITNRASVCQ